MRGSQQVLRGSAAAGEQLCCVYRMFGRCEHKWRHADFCRLRADSVQTVRRQRADSVQIRVDLQIYTNLHRGFQICINLHEIYTKSTRICISLSLTKQANNSVLVAKQPIVRAASTG